MNKQELIDKAVHEFGGKWPAIDRNNVYMSHRPENKGATFYPFYVTNNNYGDYLYWSISEFQQRARELGYVNGYRWGVEYPTDGKKPDLDSSILVYVVDCHAPYSKEAQVIDIHWSRYDTFEIIDERYKPADTSYLETPALEPVPQDENWFDYDNQKAIALPPLSTPLQWSTNGGRDWYTTSLKYLDYVACLTSGYELHKWEDPNVKFRPLDWNRKAEAEKKRVVAEAQKHCRELSSHDLRALYDAGYLKLPSE